MIDEINKILIEQIINNKKIVYSKLLSDSFGINCFKITTTEDENYIVKFYKNNENTFNAIDSETKNIIFLNNLGLRSFPIVFSKNKDFLIISYIENNGLKPNDINSDLLKAITDLHMCTNSNYGFEFSTQIGGLEQLNDLSNNWIDFYRDNRLGYIFELINSSNKMDVSINSKIESLLKNLENHIPKEPNISLLHGDLWEGNILFNEKKFVGFIDPGSFYGHNELEIAYLTWFNPSFIGKKFLEKYNDIIKIDTEYKNYEPIYQLYYSLLNVYLWDRNYVKDVKRLLNKIKI